MQEIRIPLSNDCSLMAVCNDSEPNTIRIQVVDGDGVQQLVEVCPSGSEEIFYVDVDLADDEREGFIILNKKAPKGLNKV